MPTPIPPHERTWFTQANVPCPNTSSTAQVHKSLIFNLKNLMCGTSTAGTSSTTTGARVSASLWTVVSSSDGVNYTGSVDRWGTTYDATKLVTGSYNASHSWIVLENSNLGYQMLIDLNSTTAGTLRLAVTKTSDPFIVPSLTSAAPPATEGFHLTTTGMLNTVTYAFFGDVTAAQHYMHFSVNESGEFYILVHRAGQNIFHSFIAFMSLSGANPTDTRNYVPFYDKSVSGRGAPSAASLQGSPLNALRRTINGNIMTNGGFLSTYAAGGNDLTLATVTSSSLTNCFPAGEMEHWVTAPEYFKSGKLSDIYFIGPAAMGASSPSTGSQKYIVAGSYLLPMVDVLVNS